MADIKFDLRAQARKLEQALDELGKHAAYRINRNAVLATARRVLKAIKVNTPRPGADHPYATGELLRSARVKELRAQAGWRSAAIGFSREGGAHAPVLEAGRDEGVSPGGHYYPDMAARPFFGPAVEGALGAARDIFIERVERGFEREAAKAARRAKS